MQERQLGWLLKEYGNAQYVPMDALLAHLQQEIQVKHSIPQISYTLMHTLLTNAYAVLLAACRCCGIATTTSPEFPSWAQL